MNFFVLLATGIVLVFFIQSCDAHFCGDKNCFDILGVKRNASKSEIRRAYRKLSQEKHPDKRPGDQSVKEEFRNIGTAYEILTDDEKRFKYEDFLDNPGKYPEYFVQTEHYAPKSNTVMVIIGILIVSTIVHWLNMNYSYREAKRRSKNSVEFQRQVSRLIKSKVATSKEQAEEMINVDIVGLEEPHWRNLFIVKAAMLPGQLLRYFLWATRWMIDYKIRKIEYTKEDKLYLIQKYMDIPDKEWNALKPTEKDDFIERQLWDRENCAEYKRLKRIEDNKAGKTKKRRRHVASTSDLDEVATVD